jgi:hypothetical protein
MIDKSHPGVWIYPSGREVICRNESGRMILHERREIAWDESHGFCCLCGEGVAHLEFTLEHLTSKGSGGGKHDDRQSNLGISHLAGNVRRGSISLEKYFQFSKEERIAFCQGTVPPKVRR